MSWPRHEAHDSPWVGHTLQFEHRYVPPLGGLLDINGEKVVVTEVYPDGRIAVRRAHDWTTVSTCAAPGDINMGTLMLGNIRLVDDIEEQFGRVAVPKKKECEYCGSKAHRMHKFREREVCCGCGAFWDT